MTSVSTLLKDTTTTTVFVNDSNPKPMDSNANSTNTTTFLPAASSATKAVETENTTTDVVVNSSYTNCNSIASPHAKSAATCIGRSNKGVLWGYSVEQGRWFPMKAFAAVHPGFFEVCFKDVGGCTAPECKYSMEKSPVHYFGICDGHGGDQVNNYCANEPCEIVAEEWERGSTLNGWSKRWEVAPFKAYEGADDAFKDEALAPKSVGLTALGVIISPCQIIAANRGDCRAVPCHRTQATPLRVDHKLDRADESEKITNRGFRILNWGS